VDGGDRLTRAVAALLLCGVAFVAIRTLVAERRGEDARQATRAAFRVLAPGLFVGAVVLYVVVVFLAVAIVVLVLALLGFMTGEDGYDDAGSAVLLGTAVLLVVTVGGAIQWGVRRLRRSRGSAG
jgi:uncharacterized membrane protein